jgi:hypothetical protein
MNSSEGLKGMWIAYADHDEPIIAIFGRVILDQFNASTMGEVEVKAEYIRARWTHTEERSGWITVLDDETFEKREDALLYLFKSLFEDYT